MNRFRVHSLLLVTGLAGMGFRSLPAAEAPARSRSFELTYRATVSDLPAGKRARLWLPVPPTNEDQVVETRVPEAPPGARLLVDKLTGNRMLYVESVPDARGLLEAAVTVLVVRQEVRGADTSGGVLDTDWDRFLRPDTLVPIDGKPLDLIKDRKMPADPTAAARVLYDVVNGHMRYRKTGTGWGRGDAVWACASGFGNCSDFHSLFISLARSRKIPAKFEIGFSLPTERGAGEIQGYHCWAKFRPQGKGWLPVDISEASKAPHLRDYYFGNLTEDRVLLSTGRDLILTPPQDGQPLNFFIDPYVEVDGKAYPAEKIRRSVHFRDRQTK